MKLHLIDRGNVDSLSLNVRHQHDTHFLDVWHYHPELELVYVLKSTGTRFIGDSIEKFQEGDIVLIGKNLPHKWLNDKAFFNSSAPYNAEAISIHFKREFLGATFFNVPEMRAILKLLKASQYGVVFKHVKPKTLKRFYTLFNVKGFEQLMEFLTILNDLATQASYYILSNDGYVRTMDAKKTRGLDKVYEFVFNHFNEPITLTQVAKIAHMNPSSFSRYFKRINQKPFSRYLNEIRIGYACKLLLEGSFSITQICYDSGFNNISNFNRQFKIIKGVSPSEFIKIRKI